MYSSLQNIFSIERKQIQTENYDLTKRIGKLKEFKFNLVMNCEKLLNQNALLTNEIENCKMIIRFKKNELQPQS
jgi:hypothetical protein